MDANLEKDGSLYGGLFLTIMSDLRGSTPVWEDFTTKATKLHTSLKGTLIAITAFLDAFQKVADMATGSRGATKEIGSALTRLCMRHKAIETKLKKFTGTILDSLVTPLQECMEDWKKSVVQLDKDRAKEYKRAKQEIKKCAADTVRLQKKVKKGKVDMQNKLEIAMQDVNDKYILLEEQEKNSLRTALIEERGRFCHFVTCMKPFVDEEVSLLTEVTHLQEIMQNLCLQVDNPESLPASSEQVIHDLKGEGGTWTFQTPPSSPSSLGSRKSSMCSISSIASSSSGSAQSHSPCHNKNIQQQQAQLLGSGVRLTSVSSQDSGFTSQDTLFLRPMTPSSLNIQAQNADNVSQGTDTPEIDSTPSTPSESYPNTPSATSTWTNWPNPPGNKTDSGRPHTISSAYEKSHHTRPALSSQLFEPPPPGALDGLKPVDSQAKHNPTVTKRDRPHSSVAMPYSRPAASINKMQPVLPPLGPKPKSKAVAPPKVPPIGEQPVYANLNEISPGAIDETDTDRTPTARDPPSSNGSMKIQQNTLELQAAIKELEASTAALEGSYQDDTQASQSSLQCSSGYGTMDSTPAGSKDTIASGDYVDTGQEDKFPSEKYFTIPRNSQMGGMCRAAFQSKRPASTTGIPISAQGGAPGVLSRRSSMNTPKPPPPVRRSSSITSAPNSAVLQKYRASPPRQLGNQAPPGNQQVQSNFQYNNAQQNQSNHRHSLSASGSSEPAYAELTEIQQSIHARHQQQQQSAPATPQYALPVTNPGHLAGSTSVVNSLNAKFANRNSQQVPGMVNVQHSAKGSVYQTNSGPGDDFADLPPPPTADELEEIEKIYSVPKQTQQQQQQYPTQTQNNVQLRHPVQNPNPMGMGGNLRQSLLSEMKAGNRFRKASTDDSSEC